MKQRRTDASPLPHDTLPALAPPPAPDPFLVTARRWAGRVRRRLRSARDGLLHPLRRARARARLRALDVPPRSVLFLCLGNVCRSPYAEHRFRALAWARGWGDIDVESAGFIGPGRPPAELALELARKRGLDTSDHRSQVATREMVARSELVVLVDASHGRRLRRLGVGGVPKLVLGDLDPEPVYMRTIRDPWGEDPEVYQRVFDRLDRCLEALVEALPAEAP